MEELNYGELYEMTIFIVLEINMDRFLLAPNE
jgi:hypothetical protein